ncbi:zinc finger MYND domain-containing protein 10-like [Mytilus edulis]|uniref:zinc finger MYND domain-containing protein 10-like n=1 Tax=Mytilus edulis TaxID=6550 RepID=UPI0039F02A31
MTSENGQVLLPVEAESYVEHLHTFKVAEIGNYDWGRQHEMIEKINMQAVLNASVQEDEFIKDFLISYGKTDVLIKDLLTTEIWKEKIFTELIEMEFEPKTTFPIYMVLFHEATLVNLLETTMYFKEMCESAENCIPDLLDYCYRKLTQLTARTVEDFDDEEIDTNDALNSMSSASNMEELEKQEKKLNFEICIKSLSLLRYITDCIDNSPLSVTTRILNTLDIPILLVHLVENPPWTRQKDGKTFKYIDSKWQEISREDSLKLTKIEGQVWLSIFKLLMDPQCQQKYELDSYRKNVIIKLRAYLTEIMLDQIPVLGELLRYLEHLSMMEPPAVKKELILEQLPEMRDNILQANEGRWKKIAKKQSKTVFNPSESDMRAQAKRWAETYNFDAVESLIAEPPKCAMCGEEASKRCSRCQNEWYCRRECQVNHWPKHKTACNLLQESLQKLKLQEKSS